MLRSVLRGGGPLSRGGALRRRRYLSEDASAGGWYNRLLAEYPLTTKAVTSGVIAGSGDLTCQLLTNDSSSPVDKARCARFTLLGAGLVAPVLHVWYNFLHRFIQGSSTTDVIKRLVLDQFFFAPCFIPTFMISLSLLEGETSSIPARLRTSWAPAVTSNWMLWIPAQLVNFRFIPLNYQVLFANSVGFVWNAILSFQSSRTLLPDDPKSS